MLSFTIDALTRTFWNGPAGAPVRVNLSRLHLRECERPNGIRPFARAIIPQHARLDRRAA